MFNEIFGFVAAVIVIAAIAIPSYIIMNRLAKKA